MNFRTLLTCCLALLFAPLAANADGVLRDSAGAISSGRAGANVAHFDNGAVLMSNPAGATRLTETSLLEVRFDVYHNVFDYKDGRNDVDSSQAPAVLPEISYLRRSGRWAFGLGVFVPGGFATDYKIRDPLLGNQRNRSYAALARILPVAAYEIRDDLRFGASLGVALSLLTMDAPYYVQTGAQVGAPTRVDLSSLGAAPSWGVGVQWDPVPELTLGAAYQSESAFHLKGRSEVAVGAASGKYDAEVDITWPRNLQIGARYLLDERHQFSLEGTWFDWSDAFDKLTLKLDKGRAPGLPSSLSDELELGWHDTYGVRLGYEYFARETTFRLGYAYHSLPVPRKRVTPLVPGLLEHFVSLGVGRQWEEIGIDASVGYSWGPKVQTATSGFVGGAYNGSQMRAQSFVLFLTLRYE